MKLSMLLVVLAANVFAGNISHPTQVQLRGELGKRADLTVKRFQHHPFDDIHFIVQDVARVDGLKRRFEEYEGDVSGRTLGSWSYYSRLIGVHPKKLDIIAAEILKHQNPEGFFGIDQREIDWDYWGRQIFGHGRLLGGLVQYYRLSRDEKTLQAAINLADYFCDSIDLWNSHDQNPWTDNERKVAWTHGVENRKKFVKTHMTSILESLVMLYEVTDDEKYLQAGTDIIKLFPAFGQYHAHSYLNTMTGMAMLYDHTRDADLYERLSSLYWQDVTARGNNKEGINYEWFPHDHRTEGCTVTDWIRLNLYMWKATQRPVYLDAAENAWYNSLYFHQTGQGAFGHAIMTECGYASSYAQSWWCCSMHGLWALAEIANFIAAEKDDQVWVNFYEPAQIALNAADLDIQSRYPEKGEISITVSPHSKEFSVNVRIPAWLQDFDILVNDKAIPISMHDGYAVITREWETNDVITLNFPLELRLVDEYGRNILDLRSIPKEPVSAYFYHGPLMLAVSQKTDDQFPEIIFYDQNKDYRLQDKSELFILPNAHYLLPMTFNSTFDNLITTVKLTPMSERTIDNPWQNHLEGFKRNSATAINRKHVQILHKVQIK